jgi:ubiquinone/menaquinone biosynthesis C-methylase UbiE
MGDRHPAAGGFAAVADQYDRARPSYPPAAIDWLVHAAELAPGASVIDVGAGTGKLGEALLGHAVSITAVEPVDEMRAVLERRLPQIRAVAGTAAALPLPDGSADAVVVGQAYHWFAGDPALAEFQRVLRDDGTLVLVWNARVLTRPVWRQLGAIVDPLRGSAPSHDDQAWRASLSASPRFAPLEQRTFENAQLVSRAAMVERVESTSFIGAMEPADRASVLAAVRQLADSLAEPIALDYAAEVFVFRRLAP